MKGNQKLNEAHLQVGPPGNATAAKKLQTKEQSVIKNKINERKNLQAYITTAGN